jgi:hypothetical protein
MDRIPLRLSLALLLVLAAFAGSGQPTRAAEPIVVDQRIEGAGDLTVGDRFRYVIKVDADRGTTVTLAPGGLPPQLSLAERPSVRSVSKGAGRVQITLTLEVAAFVPGELDLPPLSLAYRNPDRSEGTLETRLARVVVQSVLTSTSDLEARDLKPQAEIGEPPPVALYAAVSALVLALLLVLGLIYWRQRSLRYLVIVPEPVLAGLGPEDRARALLDRAAAEFDASGDYVAYYSAIATTVRNYLTQRFGFAAFALTTSELQDAMGRRGHDRWQARLVAGLLSQCDAVVYAHYRPAPERADADLTAAYEIVEMSRPEEAAVDEREEVGVS